MKLAYLKPHQKICLFYGSTNIVEKSRITGYLALKESLSKDKSKEKR